MPVFSLIVPVYRVEPWLDRCVQSLMNQTFPRIEILLVDDGSPDRCGEMCDAYARQDSRVRVIHKENGGQAQARNVAITAAAGEYLVFVDGDDYVSRDYCEKLLPFARQNCDIIVVDAVSEGAHRRMTHRVHDHRRIFTGREYLLAAYGSGAMPMAAVLYCYRRAFWLEQKLDFWCGIVHEDDHLTARAFLLAQRVIDSGLCEYVYTLREDSTTNRQDMRKNGADVYAVCLDLRQRFEAIEDPVLKRWMVDGLVEKYLHVFQAGRLYRHGREFVHREFVWKNALRPKTRGKAALFCLSPRLYWHVNHLSKRLTAKGKQHG